MAPTTNDRSGSDPPTSDLVMPKLGLTMTEGLLMEWHVGVGDQVRAGEVLFVVETDKVANEIEAPGDGVIEAILVAEGEIVPPGTPLARWRGPGVASTALEGPAAGAAPTQPAVAKVHDDPAAAQAVAQSAGPDARIVATPRARRLARDGNIDLRRISGSGPGGRIKARDVERAGAAAPQSPHARALANNERLVEPGTIRSTMAQRMVEAVREIPHFYLSADVVADPLLSLRHEMNTERTPLRLTLGHFVVAAMAQALAARPEDNRIWDNGRYRVFAAVDVGIAVAVQAGLLVPVLRDAGAMGLTDLAAAHDRLVARARTGGLGVDDMHGGAVTVSNLGAQGVGYVFPIINPPQSLILGVGTARASLTVSADGEIERQMLLPIVLAADHRVFDGAEAASVLTRIINGLQEPRTLLEN